MLPIQTEAQRPPVKGYTFNVPPAPISATNTAAYAAVAASKFAGSVFAKRATPTAKRKIDAGMTTRNFVVACPTRIMSIGTTMINPPTMANTNRFQTIWRCARRSSEAEVCALSVPRLCPRAVLCSMSFGSNDPSRSESLKKVGWSSVTLRPRSVMSAAWSFDPGPVLIREAAMFLTNCVSHLLAWINSKSRKALASILRQMEEAPSD